MLSRISFFFFFSSYRFTYRTTTRLGLLGQMLHLALQRRRARARDGPVHLVPVLEEQKRGEGADAELKGQVGHVVGVELGEGVGLVDGVGLGVLDEEGGDGLAGAAPGCAGLEGDVGV